MFESSGGTGAQSRNVDYDRALELLLRRAAGIGTRLTRVEVYSSRARQLPEAERTIPASEVPVPLNLSESSDFEQLRLAITRGAAQTARAPNAKGGGNPRKRLRLHLDFAAGETPSAERLAELLRGGAPMIKEVRYRPAPTASVAADAPRRAFGSSKGQGWINDQAKKKAIENYAMARARAHFEAAGWTVEDVATEYLGYDLRCTRGVEQQRVEVKGTTGAGVSVILTKNEVAQAHDEPRGSALVVVAMIDAQRVEDEWVCSGGVVRILTDWDPRGAGQLEVEQYKYTLPPYEDG